jgi:hypothetical protein
MVTIDIKHLSHSGTLSLKKSVNSVCRQEVTACFISASVANHLPVRCFLWDLKRWKISEYKTRTVRMAAPNLPDAASRHSSGWLYGGHWYVHTLTHANPGGHCAIHITTHRPDSQFTTSLVSVHHSQHYTPFTALYPIHNNFLSSYILYPSVRCRLNCKFNWDCTVDWFWHITSVIVFCVVTSLQLATSGWNMSVVAT